MQYRKIISFTLIVNLFLLAGLCMTYSEAQPPFIPPGNHLPQTQQRGVCRKDPSITITGEQTKQLENLERFFVAEIKPLWDELRDLRLETRYTGSDSQIQSQVIFEKQMRITTLQAKIEDLRFSYMIKARSIFTKEQLDRFPPDCPLKMGAGIGKGRGMGRGFQRGIR